MRVTSIATAIALALAAGCGSESRVNPPGDGGIGTSSVNVSGEITASTTWTADKTYVLKDLVFVRAPAVLTIQAGTRVKGERGSALIVTRGAKIVAEGTAQAPIVFTSAKPEGARNRGDWGGVVLLGRAPINVAGGENAIEGIVNTDGRGTYGGSDPADSSGTLRYVRIEFAGFELSPDNELNGLTCGGCGSGTVLDYIQVHRAADDGIEFFGGTVNLKHAVITLPNDDGLDWDFGWQGKAQFIVIQQEAANGENGYEGDNNRDSPEASPRSSPTIYNATIVGSNAPPGQTAQTQRGMVLRRGTGARLYNHLILGMSATAVDIRDGSETAMTSTVGQAVSGNLFIKNSCFYQNAPGAVHFPAEDGAANNDNGFDENAFFRRVEMANLFDADPRLTDPYHKTAPNWVPQAGSPVMTGAATPPSDGFFDPSATYMGAFGTTNWAAGWTAYPEN
jgi:hypothetical protein